MTDPTAALRDRIAAALYPTYGQEDRNRSLAIADAVLAVLPEQADRAAENEQLRTENERMRHELEVMYGGAFDSLKTKPADRAAVLLDAAAECDKAGGAYAERGANDAAGAAFALMETFLRKAGETEYAATPCTAPNVCEDGGEPCEAHERILGHIEGYHDLCAPDCGQEWLRRLAAEEQPATEALPAEHTWKVESPRRDQWASWGATYDDRNWARERYESAVENAPARPFRLVRATTTYAVEAEHTPAATAAPQPAAADNEETRRD